jgi:hypothetical protein
MLNRESFEEADSERNEAEKQDDEAQALDEFAARVVPVVDDPGGIQSATATNGHARSSGGPFKNFA